MSELLDRLAALELERFSIYRPPVDVKKPDSKEQKEKERKLLVRARNARERDRASIEKLCWIYFDAGRYDAGEIDEASEKAHKKMAEIEQKKTARLSAK